MVDFGAQYAQLIARRVREAGVYSELVPHTASADDIRAKDPVALVLSGGPSSVYEDGSPELDPKVFDLDVPIFGICYGFQVMAQALGGEVAHTGGREYGRTATTVLDSNDPLLSGQPESQATWMSHGDQVREAPPGFKVLASTEATPVAAFGDSGTKRYGVQWHPEVKHTDYGQDVLEHFLHDIAGLGHDWTSDSVIASQVSSIQERVGTDRVICGLSGGVDSAVAAALVQRAVGSQLVCVFVDHGLLREGEREQVERDFVEATGVQLVTVDAKDRFLGALSGVSDPEEKIGRAHV